MGRVQKWRGWDTHQPLKGEWAERSREVFSTPSGNDDGISTRGWQECITAYQLDKKLPNLKISIIVGLNAKSTEIFRKVRNEKIY